MEFRDRPRVSICSGTITPTDNRGYFHKITTQIRVSWPCTRPCLPSASSTAISSRPDRSVCSCVCTRIITTSRASTFLLSPPPPPFFRARFRFTRNFEIYERPLIVTLLFLRSLHRPVSIIAPIFPIIQPSLCFPLAFYMRLPHSCLFD